MVQFLGSIEHYKKKGNNTEIQVCGKLIKGQITVKPALASLAGEYMLFSLRSWTQSVVISYEQQKLQLKSIRAQLFIRKLSQMVALYTYHNNNLLILQYLNAVYSFSARHCSACGDECCNLIFFGLAAVYSFSQMDISTAFVTRRMVEIIREGHV